MVLFHDNPDKYNNTTTVERLQKEVPTLTNSLFQCSDNWPCLVQVNFCIDLDVQVQKMEEEICVNPQYVKKASGVLEEDEGRSSASLQSGTSKVPSFSM